MTGPDYGGARESHAGDEFHVLWAVRRALTMLLPNAPLRRLVVEGVSPKDQLDDVEDQLQGVDLTEYFDGAKFEQSSQVVIAQLKYSERKPARRWTVARLAQKPTRGKPVVARLAEAFKAFAKAYPREEVASKLRVRLISNQPLDPTLGTLLETSKARLDDQPSAARLDAVVDGLGSRQTEALERLRAASGLGKRDFADFLLALDLNGLGSGTRWRLEGEITEALSSHLIDEPGPSLAQLMQMVRIQMRPEERNSPGISRADVLVSLGGGAWDSLFPLPPRISRPASLIETRDVRALAEVIDESKGEVVVAHGDAGVGKTTTITSLEEHLPLGSVLITFDCFGKGEYLTATETRHLAKPVVLQLINEISARCGLAPLVSAPEMELLLWQKLRSTMSEAAEILGATGARLVVAVDAIDNAAIAGRVRSQQTFVRDLLTLDVPSGVTVLASCRTHRRGELGSLEGIRQYELRGFDLAASSENLRRHFPDASEESCELFHTESMGNPRSQFYALETAPRDPEDAAAQARSTEHIFEDLVKAALLEVPDPATAKSRLADLVCISRPARLLDLAGVASAPTEDVVAFCRGLVPGVELSGETVEFRDEDFETHLRGRVSATEEKKAHERLADYYSTRHREDPAAANALAPHLRLAGRDDELIELALDEGQPDAIADPLARLQAYFRRIELALQVASRSGRRDQAVRLIMLAAWAAKTDEAVSSVVRERPDLAFQHGDPEAMAKIFESANREPWRGPMHFRIAALFARLGEMENAAEQLRLAEAWIRRWVRLEESERRGWEVHAPDIAAGAEAIYHLEGAKSARAWLRRWSPLSAVLDATEIALLELAKGGSPAAAFSVLAELRPNAEIRARMLGMLFAAGFEAPPNQVGEAIGTLARRPPPRRRRAEEWTVEFLELAASACPDHPQLRHLMSALIGTVPTLPPYRLGALGEWQRTLRVRCLQAAIEGEKLSAETLIPPKYREESPEPNDYRDRQDHEQVRRRYRDLFARYLSIYTARANALLAPAVGDAVRDQIQTELVGLENLAPYQRREEAIGAYESWADAALGALAALSSDSTEVIAAVIDAAPKVEAAAAFSVPITAAARLIHQSRYRSLAFGLLDRVSAETEISAEPAGERSTRLLRMAGIADPYNAELAGDFFDRAVKAAEGLDQQGVGVLRVGAAIGTALGEAAPDPELAERLARAIERYVPFVPDADHLPWREVISAVTHLHSPAGFALATRWESEARLGLGVSVAELVPVANELGFLAPEECLQILRLGERRSFPVKHAIGCLEELRRGGAPKRARLGSALASLSLYVRRDLLDQDRFATAIALSEWLAENDLDHLPGAAELLQTADFAKALKRPDSDGGIELRRKDPDEKVAAVLDAAREDSPERLEQHLGELNDLYGGPRQLAAYLDRFAEGLAPSQRRAALEALARLPESNWAFSGEVLLSALARWLARWGSSRRVSDWVETELPDLIRNRLSALVRYDETASAALPLLLDSLRLRDGSAILIEAVAPNLARLQASALFAVAASLAPRLPEEQMSAVLAWTFRELEDEEPPKAPPLPSSPSATLARLHWTLFGHPDKRVRWDAAHCARGLVEGGNSELPGELVELLGDRQAGAFVGYGREFLWISAQQWALLLIARVADEAPGTLAGRGESLATIATDPNWPHASVREFARRAALRVAELDSSEILVQRREELKTINRAKGLLPEVDGYRSLRERSDQGEDKRIRFDAMDTLPYWFGSLGRVFACDTSEIAVAAEKWIVEKLYISEGDIEAAREQRDGLYDYGETGKRQGAFPRVETYRTYLEYHAMLLVAGEFIAEGRLVDPGWHDQTEDPWLIWLSEHLDASPSHWSVDLREPVPLEPANFGELGPIENWRDIDPDLFELALHDSDTIVVDSRLEVSDQDRYGTTSVTSALVSPVSAGALQSALQTCANPNNFRLPGEGPEMGSDAEIDEPDFQLRGYVEFVRREIEGLEEHDPLRRISLGFARPGEIFMASMGLREERDGRDLCLPDGTLVSRVRAWSDQPPEDDRYGRGTFGSGGQVVLDRALLLAFMRKRGMDVVFEVRIARQFSEQFSTQKEEPYDFGTSKIFLLRQSGELQRLA